MVCCGLLLGTAMQEFLSLLAFIGFLCLLTLSFPKVFSSFLALLLFLFLKILPPSFLVIYSRLQHYPIQQHFLNLGVGVYIHPQGLREAYNIHSS